MRNGQGLPQCPVVKTPHFAGGAQVRLLIRTTKKENKPINLPGPPEPQTYWTHQEAVKSGGLRPQGACNGWGQLATAQCGCSPGRRSGVSGLCAPCIVGSDPRAQVGPEILHLEQARWRRCPRPHSKVPEQRRDGHSPAPRSTHRVSSRTITNQWCAKGTPGSETPSDLSGATVSKLAEKNAFEQLGHREHQLEINYYGIVAFWLYISYDNAKASIRSKMSRVRFAKLKFFEKNQPKHEAVGRDDKTVKVTVRAQASPHYLVFIHI